MSDQVEEIKIRNDIVAVIGEYIELKKAGRNFKGLCPFHTEKSPSFMVSPELQLFKCFGCGESGDVFTFLQKHEGLEFYEALKLLAAKVGIELQKTSGAHSAKERLFRVNDLVGKFYQYVLLSHSLGEKALDYLLTERGLTLETIKQFQLGFSPEDAHAFTSYLIKKKRVPPALLEEAGIAYMKGSYAVDRFRGRVIFPLHNHLGAICGFAGRILPWGRSDTAKYINTPDTPIYHKSTMLYGLHTTKREIKNTKELIVVEGELDMLSTWQAGIRNVVALKGTAFTQDQAHLISRFTEKVILALDADVAGDSATRRGIIIAEEAGLEVHIAQITDAKDPDEAARNDLEGYKKALKDAIPIWDFFIESACKQYDITTASGKNHITKIVLPVLSSIKNAIVQAHYVNSLASKLRVPAEILFAELEKEKKPQTKNADEILVTPKTRQERLEEELLTIAFNHAPERLDDETAAFVTTPRLRRLVEHFLSLDSKTTFSSKTFAQTLPTELQSTFAELMMIDMSEETFNENSWKNLLSELQELSLKTRMNELQLLMVKYEAEKSRNELFNVQKEFSAVSKELTQLHKTQNSSK